MGRTSKAGMTTEESFKIELSYLFKKGYLIKGRITYGLLRWEDCSVSIEAALTENVKYIRLIYSVLTPGGLMNYDYRINIVAIPSNLGKGERYYFRCPINGNMCAILYRAYNSHIWKGITAYSERIYYPTQIASKLLKHNQARQAATNRLIQYSAKRQTFRFKGNLTKRAARIIDLANRVQLHNSSLIQVAAKRLTAYN